MIEMMLISIVLSILLGLALIFLVFSHFFSVKKKVLPSNLPPGSMGWPLVGETFAFFKPHKSNSIGTYLQQHISRYGRVFKTNLIGSPTIISCDFDLNMFILQNEDKLFQVYYPKAIHGILGKLSLITVTGELHKKLRSHAVAFNSESKSSPRFLNYVEDMTISMLQSWKGHKQVSFCREAKKLTMKIMVRRLMGITPEQLSKSTLLPDFLTFMKGFVSLPLNIPGTPFYKAVKARGRIANTIREILKEKRKNRGKLAEEDDFLDVILSKGSLNDDEIASIILDIMLAGYDTTSTILALIVYFLAHAPLVLQQLQEEQQTIKKGKKEDYLTWEDYRQMEFTQKVIMEAMRCGNVVKFLHRKAIQDVEYKGLFIPSGWQVLTLFTVTHFDSSLYKNPYVFNPWRWEDPTTNKYVTPFGGGIRLCPGTELAKIMITFFIHHFVLNYKWKIKDEDEYPLAYPYVEFHKGLQLEIEEIECIMTSNSCGC